MGLISQTRRFKLGQPLTNDSFMGGYTRAQVIALSGLKQGWTEGMLTPVGNARVQQITASQTFENMYINDVHIISNGVTVNYINCVIEPDFMYVVGSPIAGGGSVPTNGGIVNNTSGGTVVITNCVIRQKQIWAWWRLNCFHGKNATISWCNMYNGTDIVGIVGDDGANCNVSLTYNWMHDTCFIYWPSAAADQAVYDGTYLADPEEHSDQRTHNDLIQHHRGHSAYVRYNVLDGYNSQTIGTLVLASGGLLPLGYGVPSGMTASQFAHPYASLSGQNRNFQTNGQVVLLSITAGPTTGGDYSYNWVDGGINAGIHLHYGSSTYAGTINGGTISYNRYGTGARFVSGVQSFTKISSRNSGSPVMDAVTIGDVMDITGADAPVQRVTS